MHTARPDKKRSGRVRAQSRRGGALPPYSLPSSGGRLRTTPYASALEPAHAAAALLKAGVRQSVRRCLLKVLWPHQARPSTQPPAPSHFSSFRVRLWRRGQSRAVPVGAAASRGAMAADLSGHRTNLCKVQVRAAPHSRRTLIFVISLKRTVRKPTSGTLIYSGLLPYQGGKDPNARG